VARVLVVEDAADICTTLATLCETWGHEVEAAMTAHEAFASVAAFQPDVILLDLTLPNEADGLEVARRIRAGAGSGLYIIALAAWTTPAGRARALIAGANMFVMKPPELDVLKRTIDRLAKRKRRRS
jgi:two-component system CheB/CheR fusion protein